MKLDDEPRKQEDKLRWLQIKAVFDEADEVSASDWPEFLKARCDGDVDLRQQVEELLVIRLQPDLTVDRLKVPRIASPASPLPSGPRLEPGDTIAQRYRIARFIAAGGMGEVYEAHSLETGQTVALKCIRESTLGSGGNGRGRFLREAKLALQIEHRNVCRVYEHFEEDGERFIAMEFIEGETLASCLAREGFFSPHSALPIARQLCDGLAAAHQAGVLHRDLKPSNIILTSDNRAVIIDFGLAAPTTSDHSLTPPTAVIGTLAYVAPEQLENGQCRVESDIYSLGVVLYEMLTGEKPHPGKSPFRIAAEKAREAHRRPDLVACGLSAMWQEVLDRCLKARPEERLHSAAEVKALIDRGKPTTSYAAARWMRTAMIPLIAAGVTAFASIGWTWRIADHRPTSEAAALYEQAQGALAESAPMRGAELLDKAAALDPKFVQARTLQAVALTEVDQQDQASDAVLQATSAADKRWFLGRGESLMLDAARAVVTRDYKTAAERYARLAQSSSGRQRQHALMLQARMLEQMGQNDEALKVLTAAVKVDPSNWAARVHYAVQLSRKDREEAAKEFEAAEKALESSGNLDGLSDALLARFTTNTQDREEQYKALERVIEISSRTGNRYNILTAKLAMAVVFESRRDYDRAVEISREAVDQARRENLRTVYARALTVHRYASIFKKQPALAEPILREAVKVAQRTKSHRALAAARMQWGETLGSLGRIEEAYKAMEPAIAWLRQANNPDTFPTMLIKWGRVLGIVGRVDESMRAFQESVDLATKRGGMEMMVSTALVNIAGYYGQRDFHRQATILAQVVEACRKAKNDAMLLSAAQGFANHGDFDKAEELIAEAEQLVSAYQVEAAKVNQRKAAARARLRVAFLKGDCASARRLLPAADDTSTNPHRLPLCDPNASAAQLRDSRQWFERRTNEFSAQEWERPLDYSISAGQFALVLKDWQGGAAHALRGLEGAKRYNQPFLELEATLVLRAAKHGMGKRAEVPALTARVQELVKSIGFDRPAEFNGRADLLRVWRMVPAVS